MNLAHLYLAPPVRGDVVEISQRFLSRDVKFVFFSNSNFDRFIARQWPLFNAGKVLISQNLDQPVFGS